MKLESVNFCCMVKTQNQNWTNLKIKIIWSGKIPPLVISVLVYILSTLHDPSHSFKSYVNLSRPFSVLQKEFGAPYFSPYP